MSYKNVHEVVNVLINAAFTSRNTNCKPAFDSVSFEISDKKQNTNSTEVLSGPDNCNKNKCEIWIMVVICLYEYI